ncbi:hypothetical protein [Mesobacillus foraminis]|uniref:hypothetical protein n=1 Tax=Mesobacillus foraminis TaxID=279826 RepID=UPI000EF501B5|nr:hypothetical protein [Mesobacillus foraminis]
MSHKIVKSEVKSGEKSKGPEGTEEFILLETIHVPVAFLNSYPNPVKTEEVLNYVKETGQLDEPILINKETRILSDGYRRYIIAKEMKIERVPVAYEKGD